MKKTITYFLLTLLVSLAAFGQEAEGDATADLGNNPLLGYFDTPFGVPPFDKIQPEHYLPAFREAMRLHNAEIDAIIYNSKAPTFENTIESLERSGQVLGSVVRVFYAVYGAHSNDEIREVAKTVSPELSAHGNNISLNQDLFKRVKVVYDQREKLDLNAEQLRLLEETYKQFVRSGVNLKPEARKRLREINTELAKLSQQFGDNLLKETNDFELIVEDRKDLGELPNSLVSAAASAAKARGHEGKWLFTLHRPSINPFLQYSPNREMRKKMFEGYAMRGDRDNENDNKKIAARMSALRVERANLMGYESHAHFVLSDNMAENPKRAMELMGKVWEPAIATAKKEAADLEKMLHEDGYKGELKGWDWRYYTEKLRKARYDLDENELRPYFEVNNVRDGVFMVCNKLFGIKFVPRDDLPKWHPTQQVFEVTEADGTHIGVVYLDFFARESKRGGAWMNDLRPQSRMDGTVYPVVTTNFNYPSPSEDSPALLSYTEAETLFHEFGHAVHGLLSDVHYSSLSGTNVPRDFVEFPSQVFENWMGEPEVLKMFAKHYKTGKPIPDALIEKLQRTAKFDQGFATTEYMAATYLDMYFHTRTTEDEIEDVRKFEADAMKALGLIEQIIPRYRTGYFAHIFSGGYSAGYYSYLWSQVLDADCFQAFKETSLFDKETAKKYRKLLASGGSKPGMDLYREFRGRDPKIEPLLERRGFLEEKSNY